MSWLILDRERQKIKNPGKNSDFPFLVPRVGVEPTRPFGTMDFESILSSSSSTAAYLIFIKFQLIFQLCIHILYSNILFLFWPQPKANRISDIFFRLVCPKERNRILDICRSRRISYVSWFFLRLFCLFGISGILFPNCFP
jgi:hypothetical protein